RAVREGSARSAARSPRRRPRTGESRRRALIAASVRASFRKHLHRIRAGACALHHDRSNIMGILSHILGCGISAASGGIFGLIGNLAAKSFQYLESKQAFVAKQAEWAHQADLLRLQAQARQPEMKPDPAPSAVAPQASWDGL